MVKVHPTWIEETWAWRKYETLKKKEEEQHLSSLQLKEPGQGGTSWIDPSQRTVAPGALRNILSTLSSTTTYQPQSICTGGGRERTRCAGCVERKNSAHSVRVQDCFTTGKIQVAPWHGVGSTCRYPIAWEEEEATTLNKTTSEHHRLRERGPKTSHPQPS